MHRSMFPLRFDHLGAVRECFEDDSRESTPGTLQVCVRCICEVKQRLRMAVNVSSVLMQMAHLAKNVGMLEVYDLGRVAFSAIWCINSCQKEATSLLLALQVLASHQCTCVCNFLLFWQCCCCIRITSCFIVSSPCETSVLVLPLPDSTRQRTHRGKVPENSVAIMTCST